MLGEDITPFERAGIKKNVNHLVIQKEMEVAEANTNPDATTYMGAPVPEFQNAFTWKVLQSPTHGCHTPQCPNSKDGFV